MKISIVTAVYNAETTIKDTILSVLDGGYNDFEHIIIDGGSTDGTLSVLKELEHDKLKWISEPDKGIYDAMNKGIEMANGDYIATLNADDYYEKGILKLIAEASKLEKEVIHGNLCYIRDSKREIHYPSIQKFHYDVSCMPTLHPATFIHRSVYKKYGGYSLDYKIAADHEYLTKLYLSEVSFHYINEVITNMRWGGAAVQFWKLQHKEQRAIHEKHGISYSKRIKFEMKCQMAILRSMVKGLISRNET